MVESNAARNPQNQKDALRWGRLCELSEGHVAREILSCAGEESFFNLLNGVAVSDLHMQSSYGSQLLKLKLKC